MTGQRVPNRGRLCVGGLMVDRRETVRILLGKRSTDRASCPNVWDVPGGHCEPGETPEYALVRELEEELGVLPTAWRWLGDVRAPASGHDDELLLHLYAVTAWEGSPHNRQTEEHAEIAWFSVDAACKLALAHPAYPAVFRTLTPTVSVG